MANDEINSLKEKINEADKVYLENHQIYNDTSTSIEELENVNFTFTVGKNNNNFHKVESTYIDLNSRIARRHQENLVLQEEVQKKHDYLVNFKKFSTRYFEIFNQIYDYFNINEYKKVLSLLNEIDVSYFTNPYHLSAIDEMAQMYYYTRACNYYYFDKEIKLSEDYLRDYVRTCKEIQSFRDFNKGDFYLNDAYKSSILFQIENIRNVDITSDASFDYFYRFYLEIKKYVDHFNNEVTLIYHLYEEELMKWYSSLTSIAFYKEKNLDRSLKYYALKDNLNMELCTTLPLRNSQNKEELCIYYEENSLLHCTNEELIKIVTDALENVKCEFNYKSIIFILNSDKITKENLKIAFSLIDKELTPSEKWKLVDTIITSYHDVDRNIVETLIKLCLKKIHYKMHLNTICHYLFIAYKYTNVTTTRLRIIRFAKSIFASPRVYRARHKLEGYEIIQVYRLASNKKINKKESTYHLGSKSTIVTGEESFIPHHRGFILISKIFLWVLLSAFIVAGIMIVKHFGIYDYRSFGYGGISLSLAFVVWTFLIVYYNSDDEILSIISRYVIYLFLFGGGGYYLYLYFSHSNARFEVNVYNISILVAIIAAVLNVLSYFYINKKEPNWLKVIFIALSSLMTLFIALITIYTLFTWTPPTIVENIVYFLK